MPPTKEDYPALILAGIIYLVIGLSISLALAQPPHRDYPYVFVTSSGERIGGYHLLTDRGWNILYNEHWQEIYRTLAIPTIKKDKENK